MNSIQPKEDNEHSAKWQLHDPFGSSKFDAAPTDRGDTVTVHAGPNTDWWSTAVGSVPESDAHRDSGPIAYQSSISEPNQNWKLSAWLTQKGQERFQQTTLFVKLVQPSDGQTKWLKTGIENEDGMQYVGAVSTDPYSDWCLVPLLEGQDRVWLEIHKDGADLILRYSYDGKRTYLLREVKGFAAGQGEEHWWHGVMVCGPKSQSTSGTATEYILS